MQFEDDFEFDQIPDFLATFPDLKTTVFPERETLYTEDGIIECPFLALRDVVLYPQMVMPLFVGRERSLAAIKAAVANDENLIVSAQKDADLQDPYFEDIYATGTEIVMGRTLRLPDDTVSVLAQGRRRVEVIEFTQFDALYSRQGARD